MAAVACAQPGGSGALERNPVPYIKSLVQIHRERDAEEITSNSRVITAEGKHRIKAKFPFKDALRGIDDLTREVIPTSGGE